MCTHSRGHNMGEALDSILEVDVPKGYLIELIVVENGTKDNTEQVVAAKTSRRWDVRYIYEARKGKSRALNIGLQSASGEVVLFVDDDLRFSRNWLSAMCEPIRNGTAAGVTSRIEIPAYLRRIWFHPYHLGWLGCLPYANPASPDEMPGANMAVCRSVIERVPSYDLELGGGALGNCEDTLFSRQICAAGFKIALARETHVEHHFDPRKLRYKQWAMSAKSAGRSHAYLLHHWQHGAISFPKIRLNFLSAKLSMRLSQSRQYGPDEEGIPPWELSYRFEIAKLLQFQAERLRKRNYTRRGLIKQSHN